MSPEREEFTAQRILVVLDDSAQGRAALEAAAELAGRLHAELLGVFVEDINLLRCAALPFAREVGFLSGMERALDIAGVERRLKAQALRLQQALAEAAERVRVQWSFRIMRGHVAAELLSALEAADLIILGKAAQSLGRQRVRLGSTARAVLAQASRTVVVLQHGMPLGRPVVAVYDGSPAAARALAVAARLAQADDKNLVVVIAAAPEAGDRVQAQAESWLLAHGLRARYRYLPDAEALGLARAARAEDGRVLVLDGTNPMLQEEMLRTLLEATSCPVVLVR